MAKTLGARLGAAVLVGAVALQTAGCTEATIKPDAAAKSVSDLVSRQTGFTPTDVNCPPGVPAKVGLDFECRFTGPDGPYTAHVKITKVDGDNVEFDIKTQRT
ncbi:MAG: DUF4333 domain-containing protein [Mycobacteriaceae bacterium]|nr:DUF4333 domain-containing protein [Mycobacteriaceae bacterium]